MKTQTKAISPLKNPQKVAAGRKGGIASAKIKSPAKAFASRLNGRQGGRPKAINPIRKTTKTPQVVWYRQPSDLTRWRKWRHFGESTSLDIEALRTQYPKYYFWCSAYKPTRLTPWVKGSHERVTSYGKKRKTLWQLFGEKQ